MLSRIKERKEHIIVALIDNPNMLQDHCHQSEKSADIFALQMNIGEYLLSRSPLRDLVPWVVKTMADGFDANFVALDYRDSFFVQTIGK